jgi:hypothetical protein
LSSACENIAIEMNRIIAANDVNNEIDLVTLSKPVITLYSAQFLKKNVNGTIAGYVKHLELNLY